MQPDEFHVVESSSFSAHAFSVYKRNAQRHEGNSFAPTTMTRMLAAEVVVGRWIKENGGHQNTSPLLPGGGVGSSGTARWRMMRPTRQCSLCSTVRPPPIQRVAHC